MRRDVVNRIEGIIKDLWPTVQVSVTSIDFYLCTFWTGNYGVGVWMLSFTYFCFCDVLPTLS